VSSPQKEKILNERILRRRQYWHLRNHGGWHEGEARTDGAGLIRHNGLMQLSWDAMRRFPDVYAVNVSAEKLKFHSEWRCPNDHTTVWLPHGC
jgi:hypothetical protein